MTKWREVTRSIKTILKNDLLAQRSARSKKLNSFNGEVKTN